ncbi:DUF1566 domain-containing protein [bacterium]|nr:DUF1566 domain-containing protein [bacterium]
MNLKIMGIPSSIALFTTAISISFLLHACGGKDDNNNPPGGSNQNQTSKSIPTLSSSEPSEITIYYANPGGKISDNGGADITSRGVVWSEKQQPTIDDNKVEATDVSDDFVSEIYGLSASTTYYVRAYASNSEGTAYGNEIKIETPQFTSVTVGGKTLYIAPQVEFFNGNWADNDKPTFASDKMDGAKNTQIIASKNGQYAAKYCAEKDAYGFSDWYMPSIDELNAILHIKDKANIPPVTIWSSTEDDILTGDAYLVDFGDTNLGGIKIKTKYTGKCLCVRQAQ